MAQKRLRRRKKKEEKNRKRKRAKYHERIRSEWKKVNGGEKKRNKRKHRK